MISIIIATYNRPIHLRSFVISLALQTYRDFEVIVMDEAQDEKTKKLNKKFCKELKVKYHQCPDFNDWGQTAKEKALDFVKGEYVMFPNDDAYYVPTALEVMVKGMEGSDMVYCDWLFDNQGYNKIEVQPKVGRIDVGGFMTKTKIVKELGWKDKGNEGDGKLIEAIANKYKHKKVEGVLYVKN